MNKVKFKLFSGIFGILVIIFIIIASNYSIENNEKLINYNGNNLRISVDGDEADTLPTSGIYYLASYDCKSSNTKVTWDKDKYQLSVTNGNKKANVACYLNFKSNPLLNEMSLGSYVKYVGNNGCDDKACEGQNANYVNDTDMGYCYSSDYKFYENGWRIGYKENGSVYLISAGAPECMCSNSAAKISNNSCKDSLSEGFINKHYDNLDAIALKYCNSDYAKNGKCDSSTSWAMDATDFQKIIGKELNFSSCFKISSNMSCGYSNDLIDNGGYYWLATNDMSNSISSFSWFPTYRYVFNSSSEMLYGVRPVLYLDSSVTVIGGSGTYEDPYLIGNNAFNINDTGNDIDENGHITSVILNMISSNSSVSKMCISVDTAACTNYVDFVDTYTLDLTGYGAGEKFIYVYYKDSNNKIVASMNRSITLS